MRVRFESTLFSFLMRRYTRDTLLPTPKSWFTVTCCLSAFSFLYIALLRAKLCNDQNIPSALPNPFKGKSVMDAQKWHYKSPDGVRDESACSSHGHVHLHSKTCHMKEGGFLKTLKRTRLFYLNRKWHILVFCTGTTNITNLQNATISIKKKKMKQWQRVAG